MPKCAQCGTENPEDSRYCQRCGKQIATTTSLAALSPPIQVVTATPVGAEYYVIHGADQRRYGPLRAEDVATWVRLGRLSVHDDVQEVGGNGWVPMLQSKLRPYVLDGAHDARLVASSCPHCGAGLAVQIKRSGFGLFLVLLGIALTPLFGLGVPIFIVGFVIRWGGKGKAFYRCARCNYSSR
ncbi:MAG: zinc-ribbon domain-containing protein [Terriglobia bacterium]|jgi:hypothetical protein